MIDLIQILTFRTPVYVIGPKLSQCLVGSFVFPCLASEVLLHLSLNNGYRLFLSIKDCATG